MRIFVNSIGLQESQRESSEKQNLHSQQKQNLEEANLPLMLDAMWAANVVDIESTVRSVCQKVAVPSSLPPPCCSTYASSDDQPSL